PTSAQPLPTRPPGRSDLRPTPSHKVPVRPPPNPFPQGPRPTERAGNPMRACISRGTGSGEGNPGTPKMEVGPRRRRPANPFGGRSVTSQATREPLRRPLGHIPGDPRTRNAEVGPRPEAFPDFPGGPLSPTQSFRNVTRGEET